jgi:hypothetical protein
MKLNTVNTPKNLINFVGDHVSGGLAAHMNLFSNLTDNHKGDHEVREHTKRNV